MSVVPLDQLWVYLSGHPLLSLLVTLLAFVAAVRINRLLGGTPLVHPVTLAIALLIAFLVLADIQYATYFEGAQFIHFLLGPATVALAIPLYDLASVTLLRLMHRRSPLRGDRNHFSHRLVRKGLAPPVAVAVIWLATLAAGLSGVLLPALGPHQALIAGAQALAVLAILALLELSSPGRATTFGAEPE